MRSTDTLQFFIKTEVDTSWQDENVETPAELSSERKPDFKLLPQPITQPETSSLTVQQKDVGGNNTEETVAEKPDITVYNQLDFNIKAEDQYVIPYNTPSWGPNTNTSLSEGAPQAAGTLEEVLNNPRGNESNQREVIFCNQVRESLPEQDHEVNGHSDTPARPQDIKITEDIPESIVLPSVSTHTNIAKNVDKPSDIGRFKRINNQSTTAGSDITHIIQEKERHFQDSENALCSGGGEPARPDIQLTSGIQPTTVPVDTCAHLSPFTRRSSSGDALLQKPIVAATVETVIKENNTKSNMSLRPMQLSQGFHNFNHKPLETGSFNLRDIHVGQTHAVPDNVNNVTVNQSLITQQNCEVKIERVPVISGWGRFPRLESGLLENIKSDSLVSNFRTSSGESVQTIYVVSKFTQAKATLTSVLDKKNPMNPKKVEGIPVIDARQPPVDSLGPDRNVRAKGVSAQQSQQSKILKSKTLRTLHPETNKEPNNVPDVRLTPSDLLHERNKRTKKCSQTQPLQGSQKINMRTLRALCPEPIRQKSECELYPKHLEENVKRLKLVKKAICQGTGSELERKSENASPKSSSFLSAISQGNGESMQDYHIDSTSTQPLPGSYQWETLSNSDQIIPGHSHINCNLSPDYDAIDPSKGSINDGTPSSHIDQTGTVSEQGNVYKQLDTSLQNPVVVAGINSSGDEGESASLPSNSSLTKHMYGNDATITKKGYNRSIAHVNTVQTEQHAKMNNAAHSGLVRAGKLADSNPALRGLLHGEHAMLRVSNVKNNDINCVMAAAGETMSSETPSIVNTTLSGLILTGMLQRKPTKRQKTNVEHKSKRPRMKNRPILPKGIVLSIDNAIGMNTMGPNPTEQLPSENSVGHTNGVENIATQNSTVSQLETSFEKNPLDSVLNRKHTTSQKPVTQSSVLKSNPSLVGLLQGTGANPNTDATDRDLQALDYKRMDPGRSPGGTPAQANPALLTVLTRESPAMISPDDTQDTVDDSTCVSWGMTCNDGLGNEKNDKQFKPFVTGLLHDQNGLNLHCGKNVPQNNPALADLLQSKSSTLFKGALENKVEQSSPAVMEYAQCNDAMKLKTNPAQNNGSLLGLLQGTSKMNLNCKLRDNDTLSGSTLHVKREYTVSTEKIEEGLETQSNSCFTDVLQTHFPADTQNVVVDSTDHSASRRGVCGGGTGMETDESSPKLEEELQSKSSAGCVANTSMISTNPALRGLLQELNTSVQNDYENTFLESKTSPLCSRLDRSPTNPQPDSKHCLTLRTLDYYKSHVVKQFDQVLPGSNKTKSINNAAADPPLPQMCNGQETMNIYDEKSETHSDEVILSKMQCDTMVNSGSDQRSMYAASRAVLPAEIEAFYPENASSVPKGLAPNTMQLNSDLENSALKLKPIGRGVSSAGNAGEKTNDRNDNSALANMVLADMLRNKGIQGHYPIVDNNAGNLCPAVPKTYANEVDLNRGGVVSTEISRQKRTDTVSRELYVDKKATQNNPASMKLLHGIASVNTDKSHQAISELLQGEGISDTINGVDNTLVSSGDNNQEALLCKTEKSVPFDSDLTYHESLSSLDIEGENKVIPHMTSETDVEQERDSVLAELQVKSEGGANLMNVESTGKESDKLQDVQPIKKGPDVYTQQRTTTQKCRKVLKIILKDVLLEYPNFQTQIVHNGCMQGSSSSSVVNGVSDDGDMSVHAKDSFTLVSARDEELTLETVDEHESHEVQMSIETVKDFADLMTDKTTPVAINCELGPHNQECKIEKDLPVPFQFAITPIHFWNVNVPPPLVEVRKYQTGVVDPTAKTSAIKIDEKLARKAVNGSESNICTTCGFKFKSWKTLFNHTLIHTGEKPYECSICKKRFRQEGTLARHLRTHTKEKPYKCSHCGLAFAFTSNLRDHERRHTGEKPYKCKYCGMKFGQRHEIAKHVLSHTGNKKYVCEHCGKVFINAVYFRKHKSYHTDHSMHVCDVCGMSFPTNSNLNRHKRRHTGERPFSCDICKKSFSRKRSLTNHMLAHMK